MRLSVKSPEGRVEVFDGVDNWSFSILRQQVVKRFNLDRYGNNFYVFCSMVTKIFYTPLLSRRTDFSDFSLLFGSRELPTNNSKLMDSDMGFVSGDRLRLVINAKELLPSDRPGIFADTVESSSADGSKPNETVFEIILTEMKREGFELIKRENNDSRWKFHHPKSVLAIEIDFRIYNDLLTKCVHATANIYHPFGRRFLEPVVLEEKSDRLRTEVSECLVSPLKLALLGHENPLLHLLGSSSIAELLFEYLSARSILRLERTNKYAFEICRSERMERVWRILYERDFGRDSSEIKGGSYREAYRRKYTQQVRERNFFLNLMEPDLRAPFRPSFPNPPYRPNYPDPDIPEGPFHPTPRNPLRPENPFPSGPLSPLDPFRGGELLPSRPTRPSGIPRHYPHGSPSPDHFI